MGRGGSSQPAGKPCWLEGRCPSHPGGGGTSDWVFFGVTLGFFLAAPLPPPPKGCTGIPETLWAVGGVDHPTPILVEGGALTSVKASKKARENSAQKKVVKVTKWMQSVHKACQKECLFSKSPQKVIISPVEAVLD